MEANVTSQFIIVSLHPEKGRVVISNTRFILVGLEDNIKKGALN